MDFTSRLSALAAKVREQKSQIETEKATKNAFIMPFISTILGYDVFDPQEVVPEFTADIGIKRGEKIDYAIVRDGEVQVLIEAKRIGSALTLENASQLFRYFAATSARIALLTNGQTYHFYTDLDRPNTMDAKPFLILDLDDIDEMLIPELKKLTKDEFDLDSVVNAAGELKYIGELKRVLTAQFREPDDEWLKFLTTRVYEGAFTQRVKEQFRVLVAKAMRQFLADQASDRLKAALGAPNYLRSEDSELAAEVTSEAAVQDDLADDGVETTMEELEGFHIVRAIACSDAKVERITYRDAKSYFAILVDDNNRKPVARLHFNRSQKYIGLFDENKAETRYPLTSLEEIYAHAENIREGVRRYAD